MHSYPLDHWPEQMKIPLDVKSDGSVLSALYAEVMLVAAQISYAKDNVWEAEREIEEAQRLQPPHSKIRAETEEIRRKISARQAMILHRREHRRKSRSRTYWIEDQKIEGEWL